MSAWKVIAAVQALSTWYATCEKNRAGQRKPDSYKNRVRCRL